MRTLLFSFLCFVSWSSAQEIMAEDIPLSNEAIVLPGTLSYLQTDKKPPLVIFVHGSGNVDRNGNQGALIKANYIKQLADSLNTKGIAFYRFDKRTSNPDNFKKLKNIGFHDLVADVEVAIQYFKKDARFKSIHLIGHSQGSLVAMLASKMGVTSYTSLAGPGFSIDQTILSQISKQSAALAEAAQAHIKELKKTDTIQEVNPFLLQLFAPQNQKFIKEWMAFDPKEVLKTLGVPILLIQGDSDLQVTIDDVKALQQGVPNAQVAVIPKMNHVLKTVENLGENQSSYTDASFPISQELLEVLTQFVLSHE